jgi:hypothetical protein
MRRMAETVGENAMRVIVAVLGLALVGSAAADTLGRVRPEPAAACEGGKPHELCFEKPKDGIARAEYLSEPFYAIILKTAARCSISEAERVAVQALFPENKVFSARFYCEEDVEENIAYTNVNEEFAFLAVHAGPKLLDAAKLLPEVNATGKFPGANIRKMQAKLVYP